MKAEHEQLVRILQLAFSGERGAALAYRHHAASLANPTERAEILAIRDEELDHRERVGRILATLNAQPDSLVELRTLALGAGIVAFCHVGGWFFPMYGAGWMERRNIDDYARAARLALDCGLLAHASELLELAEAEWEHERYFREKAACHPFSRVLHVWQSPGPKTAIRARLEAEPAPAPALAVAA